MITYETTVTVKLDGKVVGHIKKQPDGWRYQPKNGYSIGDAYPTLKACQKSLEF